MIELIFGAILFLVTFSFIGYLAERENKEISALHKQDSVK